MQLDATRRVTVQKGRLAVSLKKGMHKVCESHRVLCPITIGESKKSA